jgi:hypothetical protein
VSHTVRSTVRLRKSLARVARVVVARLAVKRSARSTRVRSDGGQRCEQGNEGMARSSRRRARGSRPPLYDRSSSRGVPHIGPGSASQRCGQGSRSSGRYSRRFERCSRCRAPVASSERTLDSSSRKSGSSGFGVGAARARAQRIVAIRGAGGRRRPLITNDVRQHASRSMTA